MKILLRFHLVPLHFTTIFIHLLLISSSSVDPTGGGNPATYIRMNCETTLYPEPCYRSLVRYAYVIQKDPARLARAAIGVSISKAKHMAFYIANLTSRGDYGHEPRVSAALHDCFSVFCDAVDQMRESMKQMRRLKGSGEELMYEMSNVQTWMSAALTNEDTCADGFEEVDDEPVKTEVCGRAVKAKEMTSNALALVNSFAAKVMDP